MRALTPKVCAARAPRVVGASRVDRVRWSCPPPRCAARPRATRAQPPSRLAPRVAARARPRATPCPSLCAHH